MADPRLLTVSGLTCVLGGVRAVDGVDLTIDSGQLVGIVGPNGAGKTSLFNSVTRYVPVTSGVVRYRGHDVSRWKPERLAREGLRRTFQHGGGFGSMTVGENLVMAAEWSHSTVDAVTEALQLDRYWREVADSCSLATRKVLGIGMAILGGPDLLLLDEPFSGLDADDRDSVAETIRWVHGEGVTICFIEHDLHRTLELADHLVILDTGRVVAKGTPESLSGNPALADVYLRA